MFKCFKSSFVRGYYLRFIKRWIASLLRYINILIPKNKNLVVAFVDYENIAGRLVPYSNDNVYLVSKYIEEQENDIVIRYIPHNQFGGKGNIPISLKEKFIFITSILRAKIILLKQPLHISEFFVKKQHILALGYFIPFKADYLDIPKWWIFYSHILKKNFSPVRCGKYTTNILKDLSYKDNLFKNTNLTYIVPSDFNATVMARSHNLPINSFKTLGVPKSDLLLGNNFQLKEIYNIPNEYTNVILFTPTFRDIFIRESIEDINEEDLTIFGYKNEVKELEEFLLENKILIIIKLHKSFQFYRDLENKLMKKDKSYFKNCYFLDFETEGQYNMSLYELFNQSDAMIADYSSISFDYLIHNKPIIYNIPDILEYREYRGFSYEPIEDMMSGDKVKTIDELKASLLKIVYNKDRYQEKRKEVLSIVNEIPEGEALKNIYHYINKII